MLFDMKYYTHLGCYTHCVSTVVPYSLLQVSIVFGNHGIFISFMVLIVFIPPSMLRFRRAPVFSSNRSYLYSYDSHSTSTELNHPHFARIQIVKKLRQRQIFLKNCYTRVDASLNITKPHSSLWSVVIFPPYLHDLHLLLPRLTFHIQKLSFCLLNLVLGKHQ